MRRRRLLLILVLGVLLVLSAALGTALGSPGILYVKPSASGSGDCSNWANACTLQHALEDVASYGDEIWAATGVHTPTTTGTDRTASFQLVSGVELYGGFAGTETSRDQRDWESNVTVLSGDIDDNDITDPDGVITTTENITGTNSYHVVASSSVTETCVLDGFTVTGGKAEGGYDDPYGNGGGMCNVGGSPALINMTFSGNSAGQRGGGMYNESSSPSVTNVTFTGNFADNSGGGGMGNYLYSSPTLTDVTFSGNSASNNGGGMYNSESSPTLASVTFTGNYAKHDGGGMGNYLYSSPTLTDVTFSGNSASSHGGGMHNLWYSSPTLTGVAFSGNTGNGGGGMYNESYSSPTLVNVTISDNTGRGMYNNSSSSPTLTNVTISGNSGSGMFNESNCSPTVTNVTFSGNSGSYGGGMHNHQLSSPTLVNVTFSGNSATWYGGGIYNDHDSSPTLTNCILWGNSGGGGQIYSDRSTPIISYGLIQGGCPSGATCDHILDTDPWFVDADGLDNIVGTLDDNLRLGFTSPAIDAGDNSGVPTDTLDMDGDGNITEALPFDLDGYPRFLDVLFVPDTGAGLPPIVDMGAYEGQMVMVARVCAPLALKNYRP